VIAPSHLVRSGISTAYDANFGMEAGACAVMLILSGQTGVTFSGFYNGTIHFMQIKEAIKQRHVDLAQVNLYEQLGFTFGRVREDFVTRTEQVDGMIQRIY
jgi:6-phosphofructokinase 1